MWVSTQLWSGDNNKERSQGEQFSLKERWLGRDGLGLHFGPPLWASTLGLHFDVFLTCFALVHSNTNYIFAEISKNGLGSIPLEVPQQPVDSTIATDYFFLSKLSLPYRFPFPSCPVNPEGPPGPP